MQFKGSLGTGGTITDLPTASSSNEGYTYKVIEAGTYASQAANVGDTFISDGTQWVLIPSGDEPSGTVTSVGITVPTGMTVSGGPITSSGTIAIGIDTGYSIPTDAKQAQWDAKSNFSGSYTDLTDKPDLSVYAETSDLATVATTGSYSDLTNKPTITEVITCPTVGNITLNANTYYGYGYTALTASTTPAISDFANQGTALALLNKALKVNVTINNIAYNTELNPMGGFNYWGVYSGNVGCWTGVVKRINNSASTPTPGPAINITAYFNKVNSSAIYLVVCAQMEPNITTGLVDSGTVTNMLGYDSNGKIIKQAYTAGMANPMTTVGDLIVGAANGTPARISKPTGAYTGAVFGVTAGGANQGYMYPSDLALLSQCVINGNVGTFNNLTPGTKATADYNVTSLFNRLQEMYSRNLYYYSTLCFGITLPGMNYPRYITLNPISKPSTFGSTNGIMGYWYGSIKPYNDATPATETEYQITAWFIRTGASTCSLHVEVLQPAVASGGTQLYKHVIEAYEDPDGLGTQAQLIFVDNCPTNYLTTYGSLSACDSIMQVQSGYDSIYTGTSITFVDPNMPNIVRRATSVYYNQDIDEGTGDPISGTDHWVVEDSNSAIAPLYTNNMGETVSAI